MIKLSEFGKQAIPVYLASEYWYCAAKIHHLIKLGKVSAEQKLIGQKMHELKATEDLGSLKGILVPIKPESLEQLKKVMRHQVRKAITKKIILTNSNEYILYYGILSELNCVGVPDAIDCTNGINPVVVERKFVKHIPVEPYFDHKIQIQLYMMTLQELGFYSVKSRIEYWGADNNKLAKTFEQKFDNELKEKAIHAIKETAQIVNGSNNLIPTKNLNKCKVCEYRVLCKWRADLKAYDPPYFLDIETNLEGTLIWCVGIFDSLNVKFTQFFLEPDKNEPSILEDTIQLLLQRPVSRILSFSGSAYERRILQRRLKVNNLDKNISHRIIDVYPIIRGKLKKNVLGGLKTIATKYGYKFQFDDLSGRDAALLYNKYRRRRNHTIKTKLLKYNKDDVMALVHLSMRIPEAFDNKRLEGRVKEEDRKLLNTFYRSSYLCVSHRGNEGLRVELRFPCRSDEEQNLLIKVLKQNGFNPRYGISKNTKIIRMYGYEQVSDFLSMLGEELDKRISK